MPRITLSVSEKHLMHLEALKHWNVSVTQPCFLLQKYLDVLIDNFIDISGNSVVGLSLPTTLDIGYPCNHVFDDQS